jgi:hypothetical protein
MSTPLDPETCERMRQCEIVLKIAIQTNRVAPMCRGKDKLNLLGIAVNQFGLTRGQFRVCLGRAQSLLIEIQERDLLRTKKVVKIHGFHKKIPAGITGVKEIAAL